MGTVGTKIIGLDVNKLIEMLNSLLADEWYAYYQYWIGAKVAKGPMRNAAIAEFEEHANQELDHAMMLVDRIIQLGGVPLLHPDEWKSRSGCGYLAPTDTHVLKILDQNIKGEQCAIDSYHKLIKFVEGKDHVTRDMAVQILTEEVEHEEDLESIKEDIGLIGKN